MHLMSSLTVPYMLAYTWMPMIAIIAIATYRAKSRHAQHRASRRAKRKAHNYYLLLAGARRLFHVLCKVALLAAPDYYSGVRCNERLLLFLPKKL